MVELKTGPYGSYYRSSEDDSQPLTQAQMQVNAQYIYSFLSANGWTTIAIAGMLGNMQAESTINPSRWQNESLGNPNVGYGLVQWTPASKYIDWAYSNNLYPPDMDSNLKRILYELENNIQWIATSSYDFSFKDFSKSELTVRDCAIAFLVNYERPADQSHSVKEYRVELATAWYKFIIGEDPTPETPDTPDTPTGTKRKKRYNFLLMNANRRRNQWIRKR